MPKRFTATDKWADDWFCELSPVAKLFWIYLCDNCDHAGIWKANWKLAEFHLVDLPDMSEFQDKMLEISPGVYFLPKFIEFQYGTLRENNAAHLSVLKILRKHGLDHFAVGDGRPHLVSGKLPEEVRARVFGECGARCVYCNINVSGKFEIDHIVPISKGGTSDSRNLVLCCPPCSQRKADLTLEDFCKRNKINPLAVKERFERFGKGLHSPFEGAKDKDKDKDTDKDKDKDTDKDSSLGGSGGILEPCSHHNRADGPCGMPRVGRSRYCDHHKLKAADAWLNKTEARGGGLLGAGGVAKDALERLRKP